MPDDSNKRIGTVAESAAATALLKEGFGVSWPLGDFMGWDLVTDWEGKVNRIQVKPPRRSTPPTTSTLSMNRMGGGKRLYTKADCDFLMLILPYGDDYDELNGDGIYIVPIKEVRVKAKHICRRAWAAGRE